MCAISRVAFTAKRCFFKISTTPAPTREPLERNFIGDPHHRHQHRQDPESHHRRPDIRQFRLRRPHTMYLGSTLPSKTYFAYFGDLPFHPPFLLSPPPPTTRISGIESAARLEMGTEAPNNQKVITGKPTTKMSSHRQNTSPAGVVQVGKAVHQLT